MSTARPLADRLWERPRADGTGCWPWQGYVLPNGYARLSVGNRMTYAHRLAYEIVKGPIPEGLQVDHLCRTRACINPAHLEAVTQRENVLRGEGLTARNAVKTHCPQGHPYDDANTYQWTHGGGVRRRCRACNAAAQRNLYTEKAAGEREST